MINNNSGVGGNQPSNFNRLPRRPSTQQTESGPLFPRPGWNDSSTLSDKARQAMQQMQKQVSTYFNWRRPPGVIQPSPFPKLTDLGRPGLKPDFRMMYGGTWAPGRDKGGDVVSVPSKPDFRMMYGLGFPSNDSKPLVLKPFNLGPAPRPKLHMMYGMPNR